MGKKNKKNKNIDYFNMSPEEQMANAEVFHDVEQGEVSFLDALNYNVPSAPITPKNYKKQLESVIAPFDTENNEFQQELDNAIVSKNRTGVNLFDTKEKFNKIIDEIVSSDYKNMKNESSSYAEEKLKKKIENRRLEIIQKMKDEGSSLSEEEFKKFVDETISIFSKNIEDENSSYEEEFTPATEYEKYIPYSEVVKMESNVDDSSMYAINDEYDEIDSEIIENEDTTPVESPTIIHDVFPKISFEYNGIIGKMFIHDGYVSTPVSVCHTRTLQLNEDIVPEDSDGYASLLSKIFFFIISRKHPSVIISEDTFEIEFGVFSQINFNRFIFFKHNGFVYAYVLDEGESDNFYSVIDIFHFDNNDTLRYAIGTAYTSNTMHNTFMSNDEDEVESVMEDRHDIKTLIKIIENDPATMYAGHHSARDVMTRMQVINLAEFSAEVYSLLDELIITDEEEDDEYSDIDNYDEDENENYDDEISIDDFPEAEEVSDDDILDGEADIDDDYNAKAKVKITTETSVEASSAETINTDIESSGDSDEMVLPVIHRRS